MISHASLVQFKPVSMSVRAKVLKLKSSDITEKTRNQTSNHHTELNFSYAAHNVRGHLIRRFKYAPPNSTNQHPCCALVVPLVAEFCRGEEERTMCMD